jgi:hypothetical protein
MSGGRQAEPRVLALFTVTLPAASADPIPPAGGPAARRELQCQNCHMPNRRYLWRGIHDAKMVRSGLDITLRADRARYRVGDRVHATLAIATPGVGYAFPTYVTPQLRVRAELVDEDGRFTLAYARHLEAPSPRLRVTVTVLPDELSTRASSRPCCRREPARARRRSVKRSRPPAAPRIPYTSRSRR